MPSAAAARATPPPELVSFLEGLPEPHILIDRAYRVVAANAAYRREFAPDGAAASVLGRTCYDVSHGFATPCDQAGESCPMTAARTSGQREQVLHLHHTPGGEAYVQIELTPVAGRSAEAVWFIEKMQALRVAQGGPAAQGLVGRSSAFQAMLASVARVGPSAASVLLLGESGTGKELVARAVHEASPRACGPFVVVDCASLPDGLFESELFGHDKGAFTGAHASRPGLVESAGGGTLFLDEAGDIPLAMQVKLLRLLESGTWRRVGSTELRHSDLRLVAATHRDLPALVAEGRFREDLLHRLATFPIRLPPLRERRGDLALLVPSLLQRVAPGRRLAVAPAAMAALEAQPFPGNVRELRNVLERAALLADGERIEARHMAQALAMGVLGSAPFATEAAAPPAARTGDLAQRRRRAEAEALREGLAAHGGSRRELARALGLSERTLYRKLKGLDGG
jgi:DNA-binding NtrC family response regulator